MAQNWTDNTYDPSFVIHDTEVEEEQNFACLKSSFSGATAPPSPTPGQLWYNTSSGVLSYWTGSAWRSFATSSVDMKIWIYSNTAIPGWAIDATIADCVIAVKGGSDAYNVSGGTEAGEWTSASHNHKWLNFVTTGTTKIDPFSYNSDGSDAYITNAVAPYPQGNVSYIAGIARSYSYWSSQEGGWVEAGSSTIINTTQYPYVSPYSGDYGFYTSNDSGTPSSYRPFAAVGTIQYPVG